jgi:hypothetical protein
LPDRQRNYLCDGMCDYASKCFATFGEDWM